MLTVVLYGNSLALSSVGAGLEGRPGLHVVPVDAALPEAALRSQVLGADVVVFDAAATRPDVLALCKAHPHLLLIGIDMSSDTALVLSHESTRVWTTKDLLQVIGGHDPFAMDH